MNLNFIKKPNKERWGDVDVISKINISIPNESVSEALKKLNVSWVNPRITDQDYPFANSLVGEWEVEVLRPKNKLKFNDIVQICKEDGYGPATVFHLLAFVNATKDDSENRLLLAAGSLCVDDFEYIGCVVLTVQDGELKLGLGNWRGSKIGGHDILRVKKITNL
jgi:hypothetical protein